MAEKKPVPTKRCDVAAVKTCKPNLALMVVGISMIIVGLILGLINTAYIEILFVKTIVVNSNGWVGYTILIIGIPVLLFGMFLRFGKN